MDKRNLTNCAAIIFAAMLSPLRAQPAPAPAPPPPPVTAPLKPLADAPGIFDSTARAPGGAQIPGPKFRVTVVTKGLERPYAMAFLPDGRMLISERAGRIRLVSADGKLDPQPLSGVPAALNTNDRGFNDIALHPKFAQNGLVYFTYYKPDPTDPAPNQAKAALARGHYDGAHGLTNVHDIFVADEPIGGASAAKILFAKDGTLFLEIGVVAGASAGHASTLDAQNPASFYGKVLRLNDDGSIPKDNPFVGKPGYRGEIYALGIRNSMGMIFNPEDGALWATDNGPEGGDELNIIQPGKNYGWPVVSFGRPYSGDLTNNVGPTTADLVGPGFERPLLEWSPSLGLAALTFYTGDKFPDWKDSVFIATMIGEGVERVVFNAKGLPIRRQLMLADLGQRMRDIKQGPDGLLYLLTDEDDGALLRLDPV